jgi:acetyltransferase-like isoleucine patch superfamily enzyme
MKYENPGKNIKISAANIAIGEEVEFGNDIHVQVKGEFRIGSCSRLGSRTEIFGHNIIFGEHLFNSSGLRIGGGGRQHPQADFRIGDRCTVHNNFINVCEPVEIGNDVGLSPESAIITHGYWLSVLEGFPASFAGVRIGNGVIVGYRSLILMGVEIADYCVIGANSVVTKSLVKKGIYAGAPARFLKDITPLSPEMRVIRLKEIIDKYRQIAEYHGIEPLLKIEYPLVFCNDFKLNVEDLSYEGTEDAETDDLRDYIRKWGIRIYTKRPFKSKFEF